MAHRLRPFALPRPEALSPLFRPDTRCGRIIPDDMDMPSPAVLALSGWGYTDCDASVNFAFWGFSEVGLTGVLGSSAKTDAPNYGCWHHDRADRADSLGCSL